MSRRCDLPVRRGPTNSLPPAGQRRGSGARSSVHTATPIFIVVHLVSIPVPGTAIYCPAFNAASSSSRRSELGRKNYLFVFSKGCCLGWLSGVPTCLD